MVAGTGVAPGEGGPCSAGGSLCQSNSGSNTSPKAVSHHGPLDMRGLLEAATVICCLKYGAGDATFGRASSSPIFS